MTLTKQQKRKAKAIQRKKHKKMLRDHKKRSWGKSEETNSGYNKARADRMSAMLDETRKMRRAEYEEATKNGGIYDLTKFAEDEAEFEKELDEMMEKKMEEAKEKEMGAVLENI